MLKYIFHRHVRPDTKNVLVFTDTLPVKAKRDAAEKTIKTTYRHELDPGIRFDSYHHPAASNCWIQVADYCSEIRVGDHLDRAAHQRHGIEVWKKGPAVLAVPAVDACNTDRG